MKFILIISSLIVMSVAKPEKSTDFSCEYFDVASKSMQYYCDSFNGTLPNDCTSATFAFTEIAINQIGVEQLKIAGCVASLVSKAIQNHQEISAIDLSYSAYNSLDWFDNQLGNLIKFNASHNSLSAMSKEFFNKTPEITEIDLSNNAFTELRPSTFQSASGLTHIYLSHNQISHIEHDSFAHLTHLKYVDLSHNLMSHVYGVFAKQKNIEVNLKHTPISGFSCSNFKEVSAEITFESLDHLGTACDDNHFHIVRNSEKEGLFPVSPGHYEIHCNEQSFPKLRYLKSGRNTVDNLDALFGCLGPSVETLHLIEQPVNIDSMVLNRFPNLEWLTLHNTSLQEFDFGWIKNPSKITQLHISLNHLKQLKNVPLLKNYDNLDTFKTAENQLKNVAEILENLSPTIWSLDLSGNNVGLIYATALHRFKELNRIRLDDANLTFTNYDPFEKCEKLIALDLSHNNLENVDFSVLKPTLQRIKRLFVADCHVLDISKLLDHLGPSLERLDLSGHNFEHLNADTFKAFPNLWHLTLNNGNLSKLNADIFRHQQQLKYLNISQNTLTETSLDLRAIAHHLEVLDVSGNNLTGIQDFNRKNFPVIRFIGILNNRFSCEYLKQLRNEFSNARFSSDSWYQKDGVNCQSEISSDAILT